MNDMRAVIIPKSDQINADHLIGGPLTVTIAEVTIRPGTEQPVSIHFHGDDGKPYKPCKSMARVMVHCWGPDANAYIGRSMTLYCDPKVKWGGMAVGGIRISHISHINAPVTMALTETKGSKKLFTVQPLKVEPLAPKAPEPPAMTLAEWGAALQADLTAAQTAETVDAIVAREDVRMALAEAPDKVKARINAMVKAALDRTAGPAFDGDLAGGAVG